MYKVFFNDSTIHLSSGNDKSFKNNIADNVNLISYDFVNQMVSDIESDENGADFVLVNQEINQLWKQFRSYFKEIRAAGGLVQNDEGSFLFIKRLGVWDLPKGKIEKKETPENAAIREVEEECGLTKLQIIKPLDSTFHIYRSPYLPFPKNLVLKETKWFLMKYSGDEIPVPQTEEHIEEVRWFAKSEIGTPMSNTYRSLQEFIAKTVLTI
ncbi:MAG: NUDIX domain-containing protein [Bacteroidia bacterium]|jgi:8-oxo-dGTP pyrophosphatase MutT (NUDIX family)